MHAYLQRSSLARCGFGPLIRWQLHALRQWDQLSAARVDVLLANSRFTARRIRKFWRRESQVLHPPMQVERFRWVQPRDDFYFVFVVWTLISGWMSWWRPSIAWGCL